MRPPPIAARTVDLAGEVFGDNLLIAFVGGSYARGTQKPTSDVDTVVVLAHSDRGQETRFAECFRTLHLDAGLKMGHCGEVFDIATLEELLTFTDGCIAAVPAIQASACYLADCPLSMFRKGDVVWKMLEEPKICVYDPKALLTGLEIRALDYFRRWPMPRIQTFKSQLRLSDTSPEAKLAATWVRRAGTAQWVNTPVGIGLERWFGADLSDRAKAFQRHIPLLDAVGDPRACPLPVAGADLGAALAAQCLAHPPTVESAPR